MVDGRTGHDQQHAPPGARMTTRATRASISLGLGELAVILVFTLASALAVNPYYYGTGDNSITIPILKASINPALYPGDYLLAQRPFYYTFLWDALGLIHSRLSVSLPALFFTVYLAALYFTFLGIYRIACALFENRDTAFLALLLLLFSQKALGGVSTIERTLCTRGVAIPLLLLAIYCFVRRDVLWSFFLLGLAYLIHPLTTHYVLAMVVVISLVESPRRGLKPLLMGIPMFLLVASPLLAWKLQYSPASFHLFSADPQWVLAMRYRSSHHMFPFTWGWVAFLRLSLTLLLGGIAWWHRSPEHEERHRMFWIAGWTVVLLCVAGLVGSELRPAGIVFVAQPLRSFQFLIYFTILYLSSYLKSWMTGARWPLVALTSLAIAAWFEISADRESVPFLVFLVLGILVVARRRLWRGELARGAFVWTVTGLCCLAAFLCYSSDLREGDSTLAVVEEASPFLDVEHWAKTHTDVRDGFIVPPYEFEEFRVHGERTVYADIEDGGLMNANPAFGREWLRRMRMLGLTNPMPPWKGNARSRSMSEFSRIQIAQLRKIAREMRLPARHVFLVWPRSGRALPFPLKYRNDEYVVYKVD